MGSRALVAYERDGGYDLHYSHRGAADLRLARLLTPDDPFAGGAVERPPLAAGLPLSVVFDAVDFVVHEALYVVSAGFDVAVFLPLSLALDPATPDEGPGPAGVLVPVDPPDSTAAAAVRGWHRGARDALAAVRERGAPAVGAAPALGATAARELLAALARAEFGDRVVVR